MAKDFVKRVLELASVSQPKQAPTPKAWDAAEADLGVRLPSDFKTIVSGLGEGHFGVGLALRNPSSSSEYLQLSRKALLDFREDVSDAEESSGVSLYPNDDGLVVIAGIDRQQFLAGPDASKPEGYQLVWWDLDYERARDLNRSFAEFVCELYAGRIDEDWAAELRDYIWRGGKAPFFTP